MCGIAGFFNLDGSPADPALLANMLRVQQHRGPDDRGLRLFSLARGRSVELRPGSTPPTDSFEGALGLNRLSILDLTEAGHQPMCNADGSVILAFNGEIYNAFSFTKELQDAGFKFRSRSDTEVILYLYEHYGLQGMLERLNGMFAIVLADLRRQQIHIARDHLGIKPFYWSIAGKTVLFASEVKSFLPHPLFRAELDVEHLDEYLSFRYCSGEDYLLRGVRQLRPGHRILIDGQGPRIQRYWQIPDVPEQDGLSHSEAIEQLDHLLRTSVKSQLLSDVKIGCQLSGGIDSSLVSVFARSHFDADMDTFSVVFDDPAYSEEQWVSRAATAAHADSHRFMFSDRFFFHAIEKATWHLDQPLNHPNSLGIYLLAQRSRDLVTVLLSGEGADETFGGYTRFFYANIQPLVAPWLPFIGWLPGIGHKLNEHFSGDPIDTFIRASLFLRPDQLASVRPGARIEPILEKRRSIFAEGAVGHLKNCLKYEMQTYLVDLLVRQDKMTMAHSLENRVPFLDRQVVAFARELPTQSLIGSSPFRRNSRMRSTKVILKDLARRTFDEDFVYRPKSGFSLPLSRYFADKRFESLMNERLLPGMRRRDVFRSDIVKNWWQALPNLERGADEALWIFVAFELWAQTFLDTRQLHSDGGA